MTVTSDRFITGYKFPSELRVLVVQLAMQLFAVVGKVIVVAVVAAVAIVAAVVAVVAIVVVVVVVVAAVAIVATATAVVELVDLVVLSAMFDWQCPRLLLV